MAYIKNIFLHFRKICIHKFWVARYCFHYRLIWRGIKHDFSKFSPIEFWESVKYYNGTHSPIDECKKDKGYSKAWLHHKGRNSHHYEYWQDNFDNGGRPLCMPFKDTIEMMCDYLAAGRAYMGKDFTYIKELDWWDKKTDNPIAMHNVQLCFLTKVFIILAKTETLPSKKELKKIYDELCI